MYTSYAIESIVDGMEAYLRILASAKNMGHHKGDVEWLMPLPGSTGPSLVFKISLDDENTANRRIDELTDGIKKGAVPSFWFISPNSTPGNIVDILLSKGFRDMSDPEKPELGMALELAPITEWLPINPKITVEKVKSQSEFTIWIDIVNEALHGWPMLSLENHWPLVQRDGVSFFLASFDGIPVSTAATIQSGDRASIEFVSTLKDYRRRGVATAACSEALSELQAKGVKTVTLRAENEAIPLYEAMGFTPFFKTIAMSYPTD